MGITIARFEGDYAFLSNYFDPCPMQYEGQNFWNSEAAYQAQKCADAEEKGLFTTASPDDAKRMGKRVRLVDDWEHKRVDVMRGVVHAKFNQHKDLARQLMATGDAMLIEGNTWHDNFFGVCSCPACRNIRAYNWLGEILMEERKKLNEG